MIRQALMLTALAVVGPAAALARQQAARPPITGVSHLAVYASDLSASQDFYGRVLGAKKVADPENPRGVRYLFSDHQFVELLPLPAGQGESRLAHIAYTTTDAAALRRYLLSHGTKHATALTTSASGERWFGTRDPEGNEVQFVQHSIKTPTVSSGVVSGRIIHIGQVVRDRVVQDAFYRKLLGFRPYWYGAMREGATDWISQQVPQGRDWLEYMMIGAGSTVDAKRVDARLLGVFNHLSLGVTDMKKTVARLAAENRLSPRHDGPQMGRDGKWQANLYDPDGTRVELMELQPVAEPCCSRFTADSPTD
ncbi:VOC family protein [Sphingomonas xinjiangensis]|uniref:Catechol 2,3-dioxygenase-like lactoylglutathione lyase family enzyme n=1 Tax=Sphingomonas xinjiangensis TaxID=643568 RepID=A0A840YJZ6_9SPHN|nr:VOC family protein [Sphingomonas xinjiangensis]MBB5709210.1 catechol 2,3-dioxygenase-like lactoylglutathione lyase family enzyme [Sphingomonas xinjiangensis]